MRTDDFTYHLPEDLIAQTPIEPRDASRLLVLDRRTGTVAHRTFREIGAYLRPGDLLVLNQTRVLRARLRGTLLPGGGSAELLLLRPRGEGRWEAIGRPGRRLRPGRRIALADGAEAIVEAVEDEGVRIVSFLGDLDPETIGSPPLPPYIHAPLADPERYQTVYGRIPGSAAAPTAGLHFTPELLDALRSQGVGVATITLHIGTGTFRPVTVADPREHPMHAEEYAIDRAACAALTATRAAGGRIVAVGTTVVRVLEQIGLDAGDGSLVPGAGSTRLLILPGHRFRLVDALVTNFHLPRSTLLMLVSAFAGRELTLSAYEAAVAERYRFFSFGDAMLIL